MGQASRWLSEEKNFVCNTFQYFIKIAENEKK